MQRVWLLALLPLIVVPALGSAEKKAWQYNGAGDLRPVPRTIVLSDKKPDDLREDVVFRGKLRKYALVRYGSEGSRRVAVVVDEVSPDDWDLYVDADRNGVIEAKDKVKGTGRERLGRLDVESKRGSESLHEPRTVLWRLGATRKSISLATAGHVAGQIVLGGKRIAVRRVDGDANGLFADAGDRLWLDLNGDGKWDPITEQFPLLPVLTLQGQRYAVRGDALGARLALEPLTAEGRIRLRVQHLDRETIVVKIHAMLVSEDGAAFGVTSVDEPIVVPAGKYAIGAVSLAVQHAGAVQPTHFVFSRSGVTDAFRWHELKKDQELLLDPVGKLRFALEIDAADLKPRAGTAVYAQPQLFTADGLLINSCTLGEGGRGDGYDVGPRCSVKLCNAGGESVGTATSGFA